MHPPETVWYYPQFASNQGLCWGVHRMSEMVADQTGSVSKQQRYLPFLVLLFIGSGCAALIYEIVWFQILELVIGASSISLGILLGTFMGGMCVGSLLRSQVRFAHTSSLAGVCISGAGDRACSA